MTVQTVETPEVVYDFRAVVPWMPLPWGMSNDEWFAKELRAMVGWYRTSLEQDGVDIPEKALQSLHDAALEYRAKILAAKAAKEESKQ